MKADDRSDRIRRHLDGVARRRARGRRPVPPPQVLLQAPGLELRYGGSQPFHAASVSKLMTATLVVQLADAGRLDLDTPIGKLLPSEDVAGLPAADGVDVGRDVTVEHLLTQTSGLPDFFEPARGHETACSIRTVATDRDRTWTPRELLDEARRLPADGRPGERFAYTDTNYVLLGRIAEEARSERFADLMRRRVFDPSGMEHTSTPYDPTEGVDLAVLDVAPFWVGRHELSGARSVSVDWAGGNVVATPEDYVRFQRALHGGRLVSERSLAHMTRPRHRFRRGIHYGAGTMTLRFGELAPLLWRGLPEPVGHLGIWAAHLFFYPEHDAHVVLNFHTTRAMSASFRVHAALAALISR